MYGRVQSCRLVPGLLTALCQLFYSPRGTDFKTNPAAGAKGGIHMHPVVVLTVDQCWTLEVVRAVPTPLASIVDK